MLLKRLKIVKVWIKNTDIVKLITVIYYMKHAVQLDLTLEKIITHQNGSHTHTLMYHKYLAHATCYVSIADSTGKKFYSS